VIHVRALLRRVCISPQLELSPSELLRHDRVELECRAQSGADLLVVLDLENAGAATVQLKYTHGTFEYVPPRDANLLTLYTTEHGEGVVRAAILHVVAICLQALNETRVTKACGLQEVVPGAEGEQERKVLGEIYRPIGKTRAENAGDVRSDMVQI